MVAEVAIKRIADRSRRGRKLCGTGAYNVPIKRHNECAGDDNFKLLLLVVVVVFLKKKTSKDGAKSVVCCRRDWRLKGKYSTS